MTGCHVFLTRDRRLPRRVSEARGSFLIIMTPSELVEALDEAGETSLGKVGQYLLPDNHKWTHVMGAHNQGASEHP